MIFRISNGKSKYAYAIRSWQANWDLLTQYFDFPLEIRKIIYTTNPIESLNSTIRKYTKNKSLFPDDQSALKSTFFAIQNVQRKWVMPIRNWGIILNQFVTIFEERCKLWYSYPFTQNYSQARILRYATRIRKCNCWFFLYILTISVLSFIFFFFFSFE